MAIVVLFNPGHSMTLIAGGKSSPFRITYSHLPTTAHHRATNTERHNHGWGTAAAQHAQAGRPTAPTTARRAHGSDHRTEGHTEPRGAAAVPAPFPALPTRECGPAGPPALTCPSWRHAEGLRGGTGGSVRRSGPGGQRQPRHGTARQSTARGPRAWAAAAAPGDSGQPPPGPAHTFPIKGKKRRGKQRRSPARPLS